MLSLPFLLIKKKVFFYGLGQDKQNLRAVKKCLFKVNNEDCQLCPLNIVLFFLSL